MKKETGNTRRKKKKENEAGGRCWWTCNKKGGGVPLTSSDRDGNKAVVLLDVSLQDVRAGTQHSLEPRPVQFDTLEGSARDNSGSTGPVHQQGNLTWAT